MNEFVPLENAGGADRRDNRCRDGADAGHVRPVTESLGARHASGPGRENPRRIREIPLRSSDV